MGGRPNVIAQYFVQNINKTVIEALTIPPLMENNVQAGNRKLEIIIYITSRGTSRKVIGQIVTGYKKNWEN